MTLSVEAVYENGVLKPSQALPLEEHQRVRVIVLSTTAGTGVIPTRDAALIDWAAMSPDLEYPADEEGA
jgi:hypothetical protein